MNSVPDSADIVIAGAGIVGSAAAYFLSITPELAGRRIVLVERDRTFSLGSTARSAGGLRQQFSTPENIALSQATLAMIRDVKGMFGREADVGWREQGYLLLASRQGADALAENVAVQRGCGADIVLLAGADLAEAFPWLAMSGVVAGAYGRTGEGWFDPASLAGLFREEAKRNGAIILPGEIVGVEAGARIEAVRLSDAHRIACGALLNACGAWAGALAAMAGVALPVEPRKRFIYVIDAREVPEALRRGPLVVDPGGVWFRPEGRYFICGKSPPEAEEPPADDLDAVDHGFFETQVWPELAARVPAFESVKVINAWAGYYDTNLLDQNAIIGRHPGIQNLYFANGFSGHGAQQGPAAGRAVAEIVTYGASRSVDVGRLGYERIAAHRPLRERNVI